MLQISNNTFTALNLSPVELIYMDDVTVTLQYNNVSDVYYPGGCAGLRLTLGDYDRPQTEINSKTKSLIKQNIFKNNTGGSIVYVSTRDVDS